MTTGWDVSGIWKVFRAVEMFGVRQRGGVIPR